jgi:hypothetical protein
MHPADSTPITDWSAAEYCGSAACAEVTSTPTGVELRSNLPGAGVVRYTTDEWAVLRGAIKAGHLDGLNGGTVG